MSIPDGSTYTAETFLQATGSKNCREVNESERVGHPKGSSANNFPMSDPTNGYAVRCEGFVCTACVADTTSDPRGPYRGGPDGAVTVLENSKITACYNKTKARALDEWNRLNCDKADINQDGTVTVLDWSCMQKQFNKECPEHRQR